MEQENCDSGREGKMLREEEKEKEEVEVLAGTN